MERALYFDLYKKKTTMRTALILLCSTLLTLAGYSQANESAIKTLLEEGVKLHDEGKFQEAIAKYDAALSLEKNNVVANLEKALTLFSLENYKEAAEICKRTIKKNKGNSDLSSGYVTLGNSLDQLGKQKEALKIYDEGISQFPNYYQLYFNKGVTLAGMNQPDEALQSFEKAVQVNPLHASSHNGIARMNRSLKKPVQSYLAFARFITIEPASQRTSDNFKLMSSLFSAATKKTGENSMTINISADLFTSALNKSDNNFSTTELLMFLNEGLNTDSVRLILSPVKKFQNQLETMISSLKEQKQSGTGFYWSYYVPYFIEMKEMGFTEVFSYIAFVTTGEEFIQEWITENESIVENFLEWSNNYKWPE
jgi:tetratricopeptide (TPR) repeat protein